MAIKIVKRQSENPKVLSAVLEDDVKSLRVNAHLAMFDCVRPIIDGTGSTAKKFKSLFLHNKQ